VRQPLTARQREILDFVRESIDCGYPPTLREIAYAFNITSTNGVSDHLKALEKKGWIRREKFISRGLRVMPEAA
jgi:repressor LexA